MRIFRILQNLAAVVTMITAMSIANGPEVTRTEVWSATLMLLLMVLMLLSRHYYEEKKGEEKK